LIDDLITSKATLMLNKEAQVTIIEQSETRQKSKARKGKVFEEPSLWVTRNKNTAKETTNSLIVKTQR